MTTEWPRCTSTVILVASTSQHPNPICTYDILAHQTQPDAFASVIPGALFTLWHFQQSIVSLFHVTAVTEHDWRQALSAIE
jgi:hypothetical protein